MKARITLPAALIVLGLCSAAHAAYSVNDSGTWPRSWPRQLEPLRKQARTFVGPTVAQQHFAIRFTDRADFEAAWPQLLKVKTKGAPVFLVRSPNFFLGDGVKAGVIVHSPPVGQSNNPNTPEAPIPGVANPRVRWMNTTFLEVVVDGDDIDPDRIRFPANTPLLDERSQAKPR
ncbi:MAG: hypothetical protein ACO1SX_06425 [Actinomycetota bacterium]